jgi:hypothetical protein
MKIARRGTSRLRRAAAALLVAGLAAGGPARGGPSKPARILIPKVGQPLPAAALRTIAGEPLTFQVLHGKAVWIAFFHST